MSIFISFRHSSPIYLMIATLGTILRPTSAVMWLPLCLWHFWRVKNKVHFVFHTLIYAMYNLLQKLALRRLHLYLFFRLPVLLLSIYIDRLCYGRWVLSLWNFAQFNFFSGGSAHFGVHPWHWYNTHIL